MKKTILLGLLFFTGGTLMAQPYPGGTQIKVKSIKAPKPELPDRSPGEATSAPPVRTTKPVSAPTPVKSTTKETAAETKNKEEAVNKKLSRRITSIAD